MTASPDDYRLAILSLVGLQMNLQMMHRGDRSIIGETIDRLERCLRDGSRATEALETVAALSGKTLIGPWHDPDFLAIYSDGATRAFEQAADIAKTALTGTRS